MSLITNGLNRADNADEISQFLAALPHWVTMYI